ncbi:MAG: hypothetical protein QXX64_00710 [Nitrososphaera sp.]|nr:hypothetical protein [Candidatus Nitrososphaera gargensis]
MIPSRAVQEMTAGLPLLLTGLVLSRVRQQGQSLPFHLIKTLQ